MVRGAVSTALNSCIYQKIAVELRHIIKIVS